MEVAVSKCIYTSEAVILSVQPYLTEYFVKIAEDGEFFRISIFPRKEGIPILEERAYLNDLHHAAFRCQRERETIELRRLLLERAFAQYR
jgi:hypothetical protein